jgi:hypothetical protein
MFGCVLGGEAVEEAHEGGAMPGVAGKGAVQLIDDSFYFGHFYFAHLHFNKAICFVQKRKAAGKA